MDLATAAQPSTRPGTNNIGCYGANLTYRMTLENSAPQARPVFVYANSRNIGNVGVHNKAAGSLHVSEPGGYPEGGLFYLDWQDSLDFAHLTQGSDGSADPINVLPNTSVPLRVRCAIAGAAATPFDLVITSIAKAPLQEE